jgi:hypothetical protein
VLRLAGAVSASIFGQVTVNETMGARYIPLPCAPAFIRYDFFVSLLGAAATPLLSGLYERTGSVAVVTMVLAAFSVVTFGYALFFPNRREKLEPGCGPRRCRSQRNNRLRSVLNGRLESNR